MRGLGLAGVVAALVAALPAHAAMQFDDYSFTPVFRSCRSMANLTRDNCVCTATGIYAAINRPEEQLVTVLMRGFSVEQLRRTAPPELNRQLQNKGIFVTGNDASRLGNIIAGSVNYCTGQQDQGGGPAVRGGGGGGGGADAGGARGADDVPMPRPGERGNGPDRNARPEF